jgi:hypothetical protein
MEPIMKKKFLYYTNFDSKLIYTVNLLRLLYI